MFMSIVGVRLTKGIWHFLGEGKWENLNNYSQKKC